MKPSTLLAVSAVCAPALSSSFSLGVDGFSAFSSSTSFATSCSCRSPYAVAKPTCIDAASWSTRRRRSMAGRFYLLFRLPSSVVSPQSSLLTVSSSTEDSAGNEHDDIDPTLSASLSTTKTEVTAETFESLGLGPDLVRAARLSGWTVPTPVQSLAVKPILDLALRANSQSGDDDEEGTYGEKDNSGPAAGYDSVWCEAPTGSGKTACYALPLIKALVTLRRDERVNLSRVRGVGRKIGSRDDGGTKGDKKGKISCLVLCPTRELAVQIGTVFRTVSDALPEGRGIDVLTIHGGAPIDPQVVALAERARSGRGLDVLVSTPGRLVDVMRQSERTEDNDLSEKELERRLLAALDATGRRDAALSLAQIEDMKLDVTDDGGRSDVRYMLDNVRYLVLDEADRLLASAFRGEMDDVLELLLTPSHGAKDVVGVDDSRLKRKSTIKTFLFSATFPEQILPRVESVLRRLSSSSGPSDGPSSTLRLSSALPGAAAAFAVEDEGADEDEGDGISHRRRKRLARATQPASIVEGHASTIALRTIRVEERDRTMALRRILDEHGVVRNGKSSIKKGSSKDVNEGVNKERWDRVLVFVSTRYSSEHVTRKLRRAGIRASELHGKLDQDARTRRLDDLKSGKISVLVATDLAGRGLDVEGLNAVINYDLPRSTSDFTHRVGRTGRAGRMGTAISFVTPSNESHFDLIERRHYDGMMGITRETLVGLEPNEEEWMVRAEAARLGNPGAAHSEQGLAHDRMYGGIKGRKKSKKDKLREKAAREKAGAREKAAREKAGAREKAAKR